MPTVYPPAGQPPVASHSAADSSLLGAVARIVRAASADLPVPELRTASLRIGQASLRLGQVLDTVAAPRAVPNLRAAGEHLDTATGALLRAQDALAEYLQMIGLPGGPPPARFEQPAAAPLAPTRGRPADEPEPDDEADGDVPMGAG